jgi:hypothetical protein
MRKYLLSTSALASVALLSTAAIADVSISGEAEFDYSSKDHSIAAADGNLMSNVQEVHVSFTEKTESGLTISATNQFNTQSGASDDVSFAVEGDFGKLVFGSTDGVAGGYEMNPLGLLQEEDGGQLNGNTGAAASLDTTASISTSTGGGETNGSSKVSYHMPEVMGGLTAGVSVSTEGSVDGKDDATQFGMNYALDAGGAAVTLGYSSKSVEVDGAVDKDTTSMGIKVVSGNLSFAAATGDYNAADEDRSTQSAAISYTMANGITLGYGTVTSEDDLDVGEEYTADHYEAAYTIASGLTAVVNVSDFDYKVTTSTHENGSTAVAMNGTTTSLTLKAKF